MRAIPHLTARAAATITAFGPRCPEMGGTKRTARSDRPRVPPTDPAVRSGPSIRAVDAGRHRGRSSWSCATLSWLGTLSAMVRNTISGRRHPRRPQIQQRPSRAVAEVELAQCCPVPTAGHARRCLRHRIGDELWDRIEVELVVTGPAGAGAADNPLYRLLEKVVARHDPDGCRFRFLAPSRPDAKHLARIGVPRYGFSPLKTGSGDRPAGPDARRRRARQRRGPGLGFPVLYDASPVSAR